MPVLTGVAAALNHITGLYPPGTKVYVVAHCIGSIALSMGGLVGMERSLPEVLKELPHLMCS